MLDLLCSIHTSVNMAAAETFSPWFSLLLLQTFVAQKLVHKQNKLLDLYQL